MRVGSIDITDFGGKAAGLLQLRQLGYAVPPFFVLRISDTSSAWDDSELTYLIRRLEASREAVARRVLARRIRESIKTTTLPPVLLRQILSGIAQLDEPLIIRSSAASEDSVTASSAGQYASVIGVVKEPDQLLDAAKDVIASYYLDRAIRYRDQIGLGQHGPRMAVIFQELVPATASGVAFGLSPVTRDEDSITINATFELADLLVAGRITPDSFVVNRSSLHVERAIESKSHVSHITRGTCQKTVRPLSPPSCIAPSITDEQAVTIAKTLIRIESDVGYTADVEWAFVDSKLYVVQTRPIASRAVPQQRHRVRSGLN